MRISLKGKSVVVTGAARGLGRAYAQAAAAAGASVMVTDYDSAGAISTASEIVASGGKAVSLAGSVAEAGFGDRLINATLQSFGRLDGLIANAGVNRPKSIFEESYENAAAMVETNLMGVIETGLAAVRTFRAQGVGGSLVLVTSGARSGMQNIGTYSATKGAVASLAWSWALECAKYGIRVNALSPVALTAMSPTGLPGFDSHGPEEVAPLAVYLLSDESRRITGQVIRFDGETLMLYPAPAVPSATALGSAWSADSIAQAFEQELASGLASVGAGLELKVPLEG